MRYQITTRDVTWGTRKVAQVKHEIRLLLAESGAPNAEFIALDENPPDPVPEYLHLQCKHCDIHWYNQTFMPCPQCATKATVTKKEFKRVFLPNDYSMGQILVLE
jgi:hypothetical protein